MEDFDILYMVKTPFFLGSLGKVKEEADQIEINEEDTRNLSMRNFFLIRTLTEQNNFGELKQLMQGLVQEAH